MYKKLLIGWALLIGLSPTITFAQTESKRVLILRQGDCCPDSQWKEGEEALTRELSVIAVHETLAVNGMPIGANIRHDLSVAAIDADADVAIRLYQEREAIRGETIHADIFSWNRSGKTALYQLHFTKEQVSTPETLSIAVLQIVETVLARLLVVPPVKPIPPPPSKAPPPLAPFHRLGLDMKVGVLYSPGGVGASFATGVGLQIKPMASWMILLEGAYAPVTKDITQGSLSTTFDLAVARGLIFWDIAAGKRVFFGLGIGAGAVFAWTDQLGGGASSKTQVAWLGGSCRLHVRLAKYLALISDVKIGGLLPELKVRFDEEIVAQYGTPMLEFSLGLQVMFL